MTAEDSVNEIRPPPQMSNHLYFPFTDKTINHDTIDFLSLSCHCFAGGDDRQSASTRRTSPTTTTHSLFSFFPTSLSFFSIDEGFVTSKVGQILSDFCICRISLRHLAVEATPLLHLVLIITSKIMSFIGDTRLKTTLHHLVFFSYCCSKCYLISPSLLLLNL